MTKLIKNLMKRTHKMSVCEVSIFKLYLFVIALLLAIWFPVLLSADLLVYIVLFVVPFVYIMTSMFKKEGNFYAKIFKKGNSFCIFKKMTMFDVSAFKLAVFSSALLVAKLFPVVLTAHLGWYIWVVAFTLWYMSNMFFGNK